MTQVTGMLFGTFDGVHMGHVWLIENAKLKVKKYDAIGRKSGDSRLYIVVGRDSTVGGVKGKKPKQSERERVAAMRALFPECRVVLGHPTNRMHWLRKLRPHAVFLGYDQVAFVNVLRDEIRRTGAYETNTNQSTRIVRLKPFGEDIYKSSKIKRPHLVLRGTVVHGKKLARSVGYPTANIYLHKAMQGVLQAKGAAGVYASRVLLTTAKGTRSYLGATVIGARMHGGAPLVETHLIGYRGDCYGATLTLSVEKKLRDFKVYTNDEQLRKDISADIAHVQRYFGA